MINYKGGFVIAHNTVWNCTFINPKVKLLFKNKIEQSIFFLSFSLQGLWNEKMIPLVLVHLHLSGILIKAIPWSKFIEKKYAKQGIRGALGACVFQTWTTFPLEAIDKCLETIYDEIQSSSTRLSHSKS